MPRNDELATKFFENGEQISASITVQRPAQEVYRMWAGLSGLPAFLEGLSVGPAPDGLLELTASQAEDRSDAVRWGVEVFKDEPGSMVAWRSTGSPEVPNAGSVTLRELPFARGTEVKVVIDYIPPQGAILQRLDRAIGKDPRQFLQLALFRFRQLVEAGEVATTKGQPAGRSEGRDQEGAGDEQKFTKMQGQL